MKRVLTSTFIACLLTIGIFLYFKTNNRPFLSNLPKAVTTFENTKDTPLTSVVAQNMNVPWGIAFLPNSEILVTERSGTVRLINSQGILESGTIANITSVKKIGEGGLLGIAIHPEFVNNNYVYLYYTYDEQGGNTKNRVSRFTLENNNLINEKIIVDNIPGAQFHNGGRIKFGPDGYLYITTGDAQNPSQAQNKNSLAGKILRVTDEGAAAPRNPFGTRVYSYGHRNPQGIAWDKKGRLWSTEHGQTAQDELNMIVSGKNYGWPVIRGNESQTGMETPIINSGFATWAPGGAAIIENVVYFAGLKGSALYTIDISQDNPQVKEHFKNEFGRIRDVVSEPGNMLYITTSNLDGRGIPRENDDKILRINPDKLD